MRRLSCGAALRHLSVASGVVILLASACNKDDARAPLASVGQQLSEKYDVPHIDAGTIPTPFAFNTVPDPWSADTVDVCKAYQWTVETPITPATRDCWCDNCLEWMHQCDALQGCREEVACAAKVGCSDVNSCYLLPSPTAKDPSGKACSEVINKWGTIALPTYLLKKLTDCGNAAKCPLPQ